MRGVELDSLHRKLVRAKQSSIGHLRVDCRLSRSIPLGPNVQASTCISPVSPDLPRLGTLARPRWNLNRGRQLEGAPRDIQRRLVDVRFIDDQVNYQSFLSVISLPK